MGLLRIISVVSRIGQNSSAAGRIGQDISVRSHFSPVAFTTCKKHDDAGNPSDRALLFLSIEDNGNTLSLGFS